MTVAPEVEVLLSTLASLPMAVMITDCNGVVRWANASLYDLTGYDAEEITGKHAGMLAEDKMLSLHGILQRVVASGEPWKGITVGRWKSGDLQDVEQAITPITNATGDTTHLLWTYLGVPRCSTIGKPPRDVGADSEATTLIEAQESLRRSEERYQQLFAASGDALFLLDAHTDQIIETNERALALYGYDRDEMLTKTSGDMSAEPEATKQRSREAEKSPNQLIIIPERLHRKKDGTVFPVEIAARSFDLAGKAVLLVSCRDLTQRKQLEDALHVSEERLRLALDAASDGIWDWNVQSGEVYHSPRWKAMLGLNDYDISNDLAEWGKRIHPEDKATTYEALRKHLDGEEDQYLSEHRLRCKDGSWRWILDRGKVVTRTAEGKPLRVAGGYSDITERVRLEQSLRDSEQRYRTVADYTYDWEYWWLPEERFGYVSPSCERITGYSASEFMDNPGLVDSIVHPEDMSIWEEHYRTEPSQRHEVEFRIIRKDGTERWVGHVCQAVLGRDGTYLGQRGNNRDISEMKSATAEKAKLEEQLRNAQKLEGIGRLAGGVAHEFNNLLTVINGYSEFLLHRLDASDPRRAYAEAIHSSGERAANLTRQLLAFGRKQMIRPRVLDLNSAVRGFARTFQPLLGKNISLVTHLGGSVGTVMGDLEQLQYAMMNLVLNARDAMPDGGQLDIGTANVELDEAGVAAIDPDAVPGSYVLLTVTDNGKGMDEATRQRVFEPFFTSKGVGEGTGLGLATVYGTIRQSDGWIDVSSEVGVGTSFRVYLPRIDGPSHSEPVENGIGKAIANGIDRATILLVEDQEAVRAFTKAALEQYGYHVIDAPDGEQALAAATRHPGQIDLLVTDVVLPGMNGKALSQQLKRLQRDLNVLFISGYTADVFIDRGELEVGASFLQKPFSPRDLEAKIQGVLKAPFVSR